ncbi:MAG: AAA family ATPase [Elusimicrobia bacterium]|nr:AAA family ATPase [Elusimicrobiota bacterium]
MQAELTLYDYWRIINRRKWVALLILAATIFSTIFYTKMQPVVYSSQGLIKIKPPLSYSKIPGSDMMDYDPWSAVATELKVMTSSEIALRAALRLGMPSGANSAADIARSYKVERLQDSNLISLTSFSGSPSRAADIASAVIDAYRDYDLEQKSMQARKTLDDISSRKDEVETNLHRLERQKQRFIEQNPRTGLGSALANQLADLEIRRKELLEKYTPNHPDVVAMDERIDVIQNKLEEIPAQELELARISRELRMQEDLYTTLNKQYEEAKLGVSSIVSFVSVVNRPDPNPVPISPNRPLNLMVGSVLGLFLAVVVVFLLENLDVSISTIEDIENLLKLPVLGIIPNILSEKHLDNWLTQVFKKERYTVDAFRSVLVVNRRYASGVIESYHTLRTNIMSNLDTKNSVSLVFSSSGAAEGKTLTAVNFALAAAHSGLRTLLVDADLRRPAINQIFGTRKGPGLSDVLTGKTEWRDAVLESADFIMGGLDYEQLMRFPGIENLKVLNCGTQPDTVIDILDSADWHGLIGDLKAEFDLVIFDTPPVLLFADALMIAKHASDGVVLVYKAGKIARGALKRAKEQITGVNSRMIGVALNGVRASEMGPQYGYYYYDYKDYARR